MCQDKALKCKDCGTEFQFTALEREQYILRGFQNEPQRCKSCRDSRKNAIRGNRDFYEIPCSICGARTKVSFQTQTDKPVLCSKCFADYKGS